MSRKIIYWLVGAIIVIAIVIVGIRTKGFGLIAGSSSGERASGYSAVFLSNGQVYFGKLANVNNDWLTLTNIYYLQVEQKLQPKAEETTEQTKEEQPKLSLVKLGNELHGPRDKMVINNKHVLFWESLKDDGKVVESINKYLEDQANKPTEEKTDQ